MLDAEAPSALEIEAADEALRNAGLPDIDPFWMRWGYFTEKHATRGKVVAKPRKRS